MFAGCLGGDDDGDDNGEENGDEENGEENGDEENGDEENGDEETPDPPHLTVSTGDVTATRGEIVDIGVTVENTGEEEGTQDVTAHLDDEEVGSQSVTVEGGDFQSVTLIEVDTGDLDPDDYEYAVRTDDDEATLTLTVQPIDPESLLTVDEEQLFYSGSNSLAATVENPFPLEAEAVELTLSAPDDWETTGESDTSFDTLAPDDAQDVEWEIDVPDDAEGEHELTVEESYTIDGEEASFTTAVSAAIAQPLSAPLGLNSGGHLGGGDEPVVIDGVEFADELPDSITTLGDVGAEIHDSDEIEGTEHDALYLTEHFGEGGTEFGYEIFIENGTYEVTVHFAETFHETEADARVINVLANDELVVEEFNPFVEGGGFGAASQASFTVEVTDEFLTLRFEPVQDWPAVKGLEIRPVDDE